MFVNIVYRLVNKLMRTQLNIAVEERLQTNEAKPKRRRASPTEITRQSGKTRIVREIGLMLGLVYHFFFMAKRPSFFLLFDLKFIGRPHEPQAGLASHERPLLFPLGRLMR